MGSRMRSFSLCLFFALIATSVYGGTQLALAKQALKNRDYATAFKALTPLVKQGNPDAEVLMAHMYLMGYGVLKDQVEADKLLRAAAAKGNADAEFFLGAPSVLRHVDIPQGLKYLRLSAEQGNKDAQLLLGKTYLQGFGHYVPRDPVRADMWLRLAAKDNLPFYVNELRVAESHLSPGQIAKGKALAEAWKPKHGLKPAAKPKP